MASPLFLGALALFVVLAVVDSRFLYLVSGTLAAYAIANVAVSSSIGLRRKKAAMVPLVSCAFACMHFGWGLGFWRRLLVPEKAGTCWGN